jgi:hypothetical protein
MYPGETIMGWNGSVFLTEVCINICITGIGRERRAIGEVVSVLGADDVDEG